MDLKAFLESFLDRALHAVIQPTGFALLPEKGQRAVTFVKDGYKPYEAPQQRPVVPGRRYVFDDVDSFSAFLLRSEDFQPATTEILGRNGTLVAVNKVAHERHVATLVLDTDDAWDFWKEKCDDQDVFTITTLRRLLKARRQDVLDKSIGTMLQTVAINISNGSKIEHDAKTNIVTTSSTQKKVEVDGDVPESIMLAIPVYLGQGVRKVEIDLEPSIDEKNEKADQRLKLTMSIVDQDTVKREAWEERVGKVRELLGDEWLVGLGNIDFEK